MTDAIAIEVTCKNGPTKYFTNFTSAKEHIHQVDIVAVRCMSTEEILAELNTLTIFKKMVAV